MVLESSGKALLVELKFIEHNSEMMNGKDIVVLLGRAVEILLKEVYKAVNEPCSQEVRLANVVSSVSAAGKLTASGHSQPALQVEKLRTATTYLIGSMERLGILLEEFEVRVRLCACLSSCTPIT